jgi:addiction module RelB/DinJ family antitoxin
MDAMVTARMSQAKKDEGNEALSRLGLNASSAINRFYDYIIEHKELPFPASQPLDRDAVARRIALVDAIPLQPGNRFATMNDSAIKRERLGLS